jgi:hypothetical protein
MCVHGVGEVVGIIGPLFTTLFFMQNGLFSKILSFVSSG